MHYGILTAIVVVLAALLVLAARLLERRVRSGSPAHHETREEWFGDDTHEAE